MTAFFVWDWDKPKEGQWDANLLRQLQPTHDPFFFSLMPHKRSASHLSSQGVVPIALLLYLWTATMVDTLHSSTHLLKRGALYDTEKPYSLRFTPPEGFPRANINPERHDIDFHDIRQNKQNLDFRRDGFTNS